MSHKLHCTPVQYQEWKLKYVCTFNLPKMKHCCVTTLTTHQTAVNVHACMPWPIFALVLL